MTDETWWGYVTSGMDGRTSTQIGDCAGVGFPLNREDGLITVWVGNESALLSQSELQRFIVLLQAQIVPIKKKPLPKKPLKKKRRK